MDLIDSKYIGLISTRLQKFKKVKNNLYNFRCPICGDSKKNKNRTRGYLYQQKNNTNYKCHNCGISISFNNFLKELDPILHKKYIFEKFKEGHTGKNFPAETPSFGNFLPDFSASTNLPKLDIPKASSNTDAKLYLENRKLNSDNYYYVENFKEWTNTLQPVFDSIHEDEPRIIIPLFYQNKFVGFQGRALGASKVKYITIMLDEHAPKVYGVDKIKKNKTVYITEGPFDSDLIDNAIALCGADGDIDRLKIKDKVWIYDNEPRNKEIHSRIIRMIDKNEKVVIWPSSIKEKDINDMIMSGLDVKSVIELNTYSGLEAKLKFTHWKKI